MSSMAALWLPSCRKETFDLLVSLWPTLDEDDRRELGLALLTGPPSDLLDRFSDQAHRTERRDRMVFERLELLGRVGIPALPEELAAELRRLRELYENWQLADGEQAHFSIWSESSWRRRLGNAVDLNGVLIDELLGRLGGAGQDADDMLSDWQDLARSNPEHVRTQLVLLDPEAHAPWAAQLWAYGLRGLREIAKQSGAQGETLALLLRIPSPILDEPLVSAAAADVIEAATEEAETSRFDGRFWEAFDRVATAVALDPNNADDATENGWVSLAINRSMGRIATALLNALFAQRLTAGSGFSTDFNLRLTHLIGLGQRVHLPARVIFASRLSYLFAVAPEWTAKWLLPCFDWSDDTESSAAWDGFAWHPRIDPQLWQALKPHFLRIFTDQRFHRFDDDTARILAQLLVLVGVEFGLQETPRDVTRNAIRSMSGGTHAEVAAWIATYVEQSASGGPAGHADVDTVWDERIQPWLKSMWPPEPSLRTPAASKRLATAAIATKRSFPAAVATLEPLLIPGAVGSTVEKLASSDHPSQHPEASLRLLDLVASRDEPAYDYSALRTTLNRIREASPDIVAQATYRNWDEFLRLRNV